jgi:RNA polymerase sigma-70 factor (ECF subfamily)
MRSDRWRAASVAWPGVDVAEEDFAAYLRERADAESAHDGDLYLACACGRGDAAALAAFERAFFGDVDAVVARVKGTAPPADELKQLLRHKLFVGPDAKIRDYSGRGTLRTWFRITSTRLAINIAAHDARERPLDPDGLAFLVGGTGDPELEYFKRVYGDAFREAFREAFRALESQERNLLRYAFAQGLTVQAIGAIYDVHRATAARWVTGALDHLARGVKEKLRGRLGINDKEYDAILKLIDSQLHITLERYMQSTE